MKSDFLRWKLVKKDKLELILEGRWWEWWRQYHSKIIPHSSISNCPIPRKSFSFITEIYFRYNVASDHSIKNDGGVFLFRTPQLDVEKCPGVGAGVISLHTAPTASTPHHIEVTCVTHHPRTFSSNVERRQHWPVSTIPPEYVNTGCFSWAATTL